MSAILLAPVQAEHGPALFAWINDESLVRLHGDYHAVSAAEHEAWMASLATDATKTARVILHGENPIGLVQLTHIDAKNRSAELTIRIADPAHRGAGFGVDAVKLMLAEAFGPLNLNRVYLNVSPSNAAAIRAYEKAGMRREGVLREATRANGEVSDLVVMAKLASDTD